MSEQDLINVHKRILQIQEDKFFEKEFKKDLKKIAKSDNKRKSEKRDIYDSFADGKIDQSVFFEKQD